MGQWVTGHWDRTEGQWDSETVGNGAIGPFGQQSNGTAGQLDIGAVGKVIRAVGIVERRDSEQLAVKGNSGIFCNSLNENAAHHILWNSKSGQSATVWGRK